MPPVTLTAVTLIFEQVFGGHFPTLLYFSPTLGCRLVHKDEFDDVMEYEFEQDQFPWQVYNGSSDDLMNKKQEGKAILLEGVNSSEGSRNIPGLEARLRNELHMRAEFVEAGRATFERIGQQHQQVLKRRLEAKGKKWKNNKKLTFVGIHSRRGDYRYMPSILLFFCSQNLLVFQIASLISTGTL